MSTPERNAQPGRAAAAAEGAASVLLRQAQSADLDRVAEIERMSFGDPWSRRSFESLLHDSRVFFQVADVAGRVTGYLVAWFVGGEGEIANLAVAHDERRHGVGARLLDAAIAAARRHHDATMYLEVREGNHAARALYAGRGFLEVGRRRHYYRKPLEDALVLRLVLSGA